MSIWQVQEAKVRFSEVVKKAETEGPQDITLHGRAGAIFLHRLLPNQDVGTCLRQLRL